MIRMTGSAASRSVTACIAFTLTVLCAGHSTISAHVGDTECGTTRKELTNHLGQLKNQVRQDFQQLARLDAEARARTALADRWVELASESDAVFRAGVRDAFKTSMDAVYDELQDKAVSLAAGGLTSGPLDPKSWKQAWTKQTELDRLAEGLRQEHLDVPNLMRAIRNLNPNAAVDAGARAQAIRDLYTAFKLAFDTKRIGVELSSAGSKLHGPELDSLAHSMLDLTSVTAGLINPTYGTVVKLLYADAEYATFAGFRNLEYRYSSAELDRLAQQNEDDLIARQLLTHIIWNHVMQLKYADQDLAACGTGNVCEQAYNGIGNAALSGLQCNHNLPAPDKPKPRHHVGPGTVLAITLIGAGVPAAVIGAELAAQQQHNDPICDASFPSPSIVCNAVYESFNGTAQCASSKAAAQAYCQCEGYSTYISNATSFGINPPSATCR